MGRYSQCVLGLIGWWNTRPSCGLKQLLVCFGVITILSLLTRASAESPPKIDPLAVLLKAYQDAVSELRNRTEVSEQEVVQFREDWRTRLRNACNKFPDSPEWVVGMTKIVGLCNSLKDFKASDDTINAILEHTRTPRDRMRWLGERAEVAKLQYSIDPRPDIRELATQSYMDALEIADLQLSSKMSPQEKYHYAVYAGQLSGLLDDISQLRTAIDWLRKARILIEGCEECEAQVGGSDYDAEGLSRLQLNLAIRHHDEAFVVEALVAIGKISKQRLLRIDLSDYVYRAANGLYADVPEKYQQFILSWMNKIPPDGWTPCLKFYLARSYFENLQLDAAEPIYVKLASEDKVYFLEKDRKALAKQRGGYFAEVLANLAAINLARGKSEEAERIRTALRQLVPKDPKLDGIDSMLLSIETHNKARSELKSKVNGKRAALIGFNFLIVVVIVTLMGRKYYRRARSL